MNKIHIDVQYNKDTMSNRELVAFSAALQAQIDLLRIYGCELVNEISDRNNR